MFKNDVLLGDFGNSVVVSQPITFSMSDCISHVAVPSDITVTVHHGKYRLLERKAVVDLTLLSHMEHTLSYQCNRKS